VVVGVALLQKQRVDGPTDSPGRVESALLKDKRIHRLLLLLLQLLLQQQLLLKNERIYCLMLLLLLLLLKDERIHRLLLLLLKDERIYRSRHDGRLLLLSLLQNERIYCSHHARPVLAGSWRGHRVLLPALLLLHQDEGVHRRYRHRAPASLLILLPLPRLLFLKAEALLQLFPCVDVERQPALSERVLPNHLEVVRARPEQHCAVRVH